MSARAVVSDKGCTSAGASVFVPSRDVFTTEIDGELLALDLRTQAYYVFDGVASTMWRLLVERGDRVRVLERLGEIYDAEPQRLAADLDALVARLIAGGFAHWATAEEGVPAPARPIVRRTRVRDASTVRAWWWLARTVVGLRSDGIAGAFHRGVALTGVDPAPAEECRALAERAVRAFGRAENLFVMRRAPRDCFPRSMALFCFLRELGVPVEHRIGVDRFPFRAHAWVEYDGRVLSDQDGNARFFTTIASIAG
jgi:hypothetical protein